MVYLKIWNSIDDKLANMYKKYLCLGNIFTYSMDDAEKYGFNYQNDTYLLDLKLKDKKITRDLYFLGADKNRLAILDKVGYILKEKTNYTFLFEVYSKEKTYCKNVTFFSQFKSFYDYLDEVAKSNCLLDITTHHNITFRTIESFFFNKKLISNNPDLVKYDFYHPNNILIVDVDNIGDDFAEKLKDFFDKPFYVISDDVKKKYDFYTVYSFFESLVINKKVNLGVK
jgi:hypothetical protein